jgi:hypothetical protein
MFAALSRIALAVLTVLPATLSVTARPLNAQSTTAPGAVLVFPKIASDVDQDTIIQLTNVSARPILGRCFYVDASLLPDGGDPSWAVTDFQVKLTPLQPTVWLASEGLPASPSDRPLELHPGPIPPVGEQFVGQLRCIVVNENERPQSRNALTGNATIVDRASGRTRKYQAVALPGLPGNDGDNILLFDDVEYAACPRAVLFNHFFDDAPDPVLSSPIRSRLTVVPCSMDLENSIPGEALLQFEVFNEFEQRLSATLDVVCFEDVPLSGIDAGGDPSLSIFNFALQGTLVGVTRIRSVVDAGIDHGHGVIALGEEFRGNGTVSSAMNLHFIGGNLQADVVVLPTPF